MFQDGFVGSNSVQQAEEVEKASGETMYSTVKKFEIEANELQEHALLILVD